MKQINMNRKVVEDNLSRLILSIKQEYDRKREDDDLYKCRYCERKYEKASDIVNHEYICEFKN